MEIKVYGRICKSATFAKKMVMNYLNNFNIKLKDLSIEGLSNVVYDSTIKPKIASKKISKISSNVEVDLVNKEKSRRSTAYLKNGKLVLESDSILNEAELSISSFMPFANEFCSRNYDYNGIGISADETKDRDTYVRLVLIGDYIVGITNTQGVSSMEFDCIIGLGLERSAFKQWNSRFSGGDGAVLNITASVTNETEDFYEIEYRLTFETGDDLNLIHINNSFIMTVYNKIIINDNSTEYLFYKEVANS